MKKLAGLAAVLLLCVACTHKENEGADSGITEEFHQLDADHDGNITKAEAEKGGSPMLLSRFDEFDKDKNGKLSLKEVTAFVKAQRAEDARIKDAEFRRLDADHDGGISLEETKKGDAMLLTTNFGSIDTDKDGKLSLQELDAFDKMVNAPPGKPKPREGAQSSVAGSAGPLFREADTDHNGTLSKEELSKQPELLRNFDKMDADHDGKITPREIDTYMRALEKPRPDESAKSGVRSTPVK